MSTTLIIELSGGLFLPPEMLESAHFPREAKVVVDVTDDHILLKAATPEREARVVQKGGRLVIAGAPPLTDAEVSSAIKVGRDERDGQIIGVWSAQWIRACS